MKISLYLCLSYENIIYICVKRFPADNTNTKSKYQESGKHLHFINFMKANTIQAYRHVLAPIIRKILSKYVYYFGTILIIEYVHINTKFN